MRETVTINRIIQCSFIGKEVAQQISAYTLTMQQNQITSEILTKYCSAEHVCKCSNCQFIIGLSGKSYTKSLESIYTCLSKE